MKEITHSIRYPFAIDRGFGTLAEENQYPAHVEQLIRQVLFTNPGERVNRPDFGSGLMQLVFAPSSDEVVTATQFMVQGALQQWLGDLIQVEDVQVESEESSLQVTIQYILLRNQQRQVAQFTREGF